MMEFRSSISKTLIPSIEQAMKGKHKDRWRPERRTARMGKQNSGRAWKIRSLYKGRIKGSSRSAGREESFSQVSTCKILEIHLRNV